RDDVPRLGRPPVFPRDRLGPRGPRRGHGGQARAARRRRHRLVVVRRGARLEALRRHCGALGGNHTLSLTFTDDVGAAGPGRALHADAVSIAKTAPVRPLGPAARVQAETFPARLGWGYSQRDPTASGGARWKQAGNGSIIMTYAPAGPGNVTFTITAKGEPALGAWPELKLRIDNATRIRWNASSWL